MSQKNTSKNNKNDAKIPVTSKPGLEFIRRTMMINSNIQVKKREQ